MALDNAKKLVEELGANPELKAQFQADAQAALAAGDYGCTLDELDEAVLLSRELDEGELATVAGGHNCTIFSSDKILGGCTQDYFIEQCAATVEDGSLCGTNDFCSTWDVVYNRVDLQDQILDYGYFH